MALDNHGINHGVWLGDNPLCLNYVEFRNQHMCILPLELYIKSIIWIIELEGLAFVCYRIVWVPTVLHVYDLFQLSACNNMSKISFTIVYPFCLCLFSCVVSPFCNNHQLFSVSRCENP